MSANESLKDYRPERHPYAEPQTWYFTFGSAHHYANRYVVVKDATGEEARERMFDLFGREWGFQYDAHDWFKGGVSQAGKYGLEELAAVRSVGDPDA